MGFFRGQSSCFGTCICERKEKANKFIAKALDVFFQSRRFFFFPLVLSLLLFDARFAHSFHFFLPNNMKMAAAFFLVVMLRTYVIPFVASSVALFAEMIQCERYVCLSYSIRGGGEETKMFFLFVSHGEVCVLARL